MTEWLVLVVALAAATFTVVKVRRFVGQVERREVVYERSIDCAQHVDFYVAAEALSEEDRLPAFLACVYCDDDAELSCRYWLDRLN